MAGIYRQRHPEHTVFYRVVFHYFAEFLREYESRFEREYGFLRPVIQDVVEKYLDCGNPMCGFARIRCPDCGEERLLMFSCKTRGFCPSCHAKRREEWGEWMREELVLDVPHRQVVFTVPKMLRLFFRFRRKLLNSLCLSAVRTLVRFLHTATGLELMPGAVVVIQTFGDRINFHPHIIRKVYEIDPLLCPSCGGKMSIISFIEEPKTIERIIGHLKLTFEAERPSPPQVIQQEPLMASEGSEEYF